ncbi:transposase [Actinoplanes sp. N902-109]|uniref:transposase n=1 Tax=Actinoplanes sp. (strain N902-109) TaxID=649831 RepID=UPI0009FFCBFE
MRRRSSPSSKPGVRTCWNTGVGPIVAATVLTAWSQPGRCRTDAAFAMLAGTAPIPASSGKTVRASNATSRANSSAVWKLPRHTLTSHRSALLPLSYG